MKNLRHVIWAVALLAVAVLVLAACGTAGDAALPPNDNPADTPATSGACLAGEPGCIDTGVIDAPGVLPDDVPPHDDSVTDSGMPADGGLTISDALATNATGIIAVKGFLVDDGTTARLCEALAESYPPQCGGASVQVVGEMVDVSLSNAQGVTWTDSTVTFFGKLIDGILVVDPTVTG